MDKYSVNDNIYNIANDFNINYKFFLTDDKDQKKSQKVLSELENIDDDCDQHNIAFVKIDDEDEAKEYGIDEVPTLVFFERKIPHIYEGKLFFSYITKNNFIYIY